MKIELEDGRIYETDKNIVYHTMGKPPSGKDVIGVMEGVSPASFLEENDIIIILNTSDFTKSYLVERIGKGFGFSFIINIVQEDDMEKEDGDYEDPDWNDTEGEE
jgi:hypothetical protein